MEFQYTYTGSVFYHVEVTDKNKWTATKLDTVYDLVEDEHKKYRYKQKGINSLEDWLQFVIRAYVDLAFNYQKIKSSYYEGINNI